jgi:acetyl esterase/lipase
MVLAGCVGGTDGRAPDAQVVAPDAQVAAPDAEVVAPDAEVVAPDAEVAALDAEVAAPDAKVAALDAEVAAPDAEVAADAEIADRDASAVEADADAPRPDAAAPLPPCPAGGAPGDIQRNLAYSDVHERNILDLYATTAPGPSPVVIWIHGGGWQGGSHAGVRPEILAFRRRGYAVASIEYRLSDHPFPAPIADTRAAVRWLRENAADLGLDPDRFAAAGSSAGGHLVAMLGVGVGVDALDDPAHGPADTSPGVQAVVDFFGPSDIGQMDADAEANGCAEDALCHDCEDSPETRLLDCRPSQCPETAALASPVTHVDPEDASFLVLHGGRDCTVPTPQGARMHDALVAAGVESTLIEVPEAGHNAGQILEPAVVAEMEAFVERHLRGCVPAEPDPPPEGALDPCLVRACPDEAGACAAVAACVDLDACFQRCHGEGENRATCVPRCLEAAGNPGGAVTGPHRAVYECGIAAGCYRN